jgi:hypothetical protein
MSLPYRPRLARSGQTLNLSWPMQWWTPVDRAIGGGERSAAGVPSNYVIRTEPLLEVRLRVTEAEWPLLVTFLRAVDAAGSAWTFRPDQNVAADLTVYLERPSVAAGEELRPEMRDEGDHTLFIVPLTLRRTTSTALDVRTA